MADRPEDAHLLRLLKTLEASEAATLGHLPPHEQRTFDIARGVALVGAALHDLPEAQRLDELRHVIAVLQVCADNLSLGVALFVETQQ